MLIEFFVPGIPAPGGSKRGFNHSKTGRVIVLEDCKRSGPWRDRVAFYAREAYSGELLDGPLEVRITFALVRPKGHFRTGKNSHIVRDSAPRYPTTKPDVLKLARSTEDALTGVLWVDDARTVDMTIRKIYDARPGAWIAVETKDPV